MLTTLKTYSNSQIMKLLLLLAISIAAANKPPFDTDLNFHWENFKKIYGKTYTNQEESARRLIWEGNVNEILHHNLDADMGLHSFKRGVNEYADLTLEEFLIRHTGLMMHAEKPRANGSLWLSPYSVKFPKRVDWREEGFVTPVKNQKDCSACWAFSSTGALEGQHKRKTGKLVSLSEQNLVDCSGTEGNHGCNGGYMDQAFNYVKKNNGIDTEESYPYTAQEGVCSFRKENVGATCTGFVDIPSANEEALKQAVATVGPISALVDAKHAEFHTYKSGIYDLLSCNSDFLKLDHAVLIVGYGTDNGKDYWLVKNSWGESWGMGGYVKMSRNKKNQCGIATSASYPLV